MARPVHRWQDKRGCAMRSIEAAPPAQPVEVTAANVEQVLQSAGCHGPNYGLMSKATDYDENFAGDGQIFPGSDAATDFPMEDVVRRLDGETENLPEENAETSMPDAKTAMQKLLGWIVEIRSKDNRGLSPIATRALASVWVVKPELVGDCAGRMVAKAYGISYQKFSIHAAEFSRTFKIQNRFQVHDGHNTRRAIL